MYQIHILSDPRHFRRRTRLKILQVQEKSVPILQMKITKVLVGTVPVFLNTKYFFLTQVPMPEEVRSNFFHR